MTAILATKTLPALVAIPVQTTVSSTLQQIGVILLLASLILEQLLLFFALLLIRIAASPNLTSTLLKHLARIRALTEHIS